MLLTRWHHWLNHTLTTCKLRRRPSPRPGYRRRGSSVDVLEDRTLLRTTVYIDFGDNFAIQSGGVQALDTTIGNVNSANINFPGIGNNDLTINNDRDNSQNLITNNDITVDNNTEVWIQSFNSWFGGVNAAAPARAVMEQLVRRFYEPFDVRVVVLTTTAQFIKNQSIAAADSLDDIAAVLGYSQGQRA